MELLYTLAAFCGVFILPGALVGSLIRFMPGAPAERPLRAFILSVCLGWAVSIPYFAGRLQMPTVVLSYLVVDLLAVVVLALRWLARSRMGRLDLRSGLPKLARFARDPLLAAFGVLFVLSLMALLLQKGLVFGDNWFHLAGIRKIANLDTYSFRQSWGRYDYPAYPPYSLPLLHLLFAVASNLARVDPIATLLYAPIFLFVLGTYVQFLLARALSGSSRFATLDATVHVLLYGLLSVTSGFYILRMVAVPDVFAGFILLPAMMCVWVELVRWPGKRDWRLLLMLALLMQATAFVHVSQVVHFVVAAVALTVCASLVGRRLVNVRLALAALVVSALLAVPYYLFMSRFIVSSVPLGSFASEVAFFQQYHVEYGWGRVVRLFGRALIINPSILMDAYSSTFLTALAYVAALRLCFMRSPGQLLFAYVLGLPLAVALVVLNPAVVGPLAATTGFVTVYRISHILPVGLAVSVLVLDLTERLKASSLVSWAPRLLCLALISTALSFAFDQAFFRVVVARAVLPALVLATLVSLIRTPPRAVELSPTAIRAGATVAVLMALVLPLVVPRLSTLTAESWQYRSHGPSTDWLPPQGTQLSPGAIRFIRQRVRPYSVFMGDRALEYLVPGYTLNYSYLGWNTQLPGYEKGTADRLALREAVLDPGTPAEEKLRLLKGVPVDYLILNKKSQAPTIFTAMKSAPRGLEAVFEDAQTLILRVKR